MTTARRSFLAVLGWRPAFWPSMALSWWASLCALINPCTVGVNSSSLTHWLTDRLRIDIMVNTRDGVN
jgi:hypothetical protein